MFRTNKESKISQQLTNYKINPIHLVGFIIILLVEIIFIVFPNTIILVSIIGSIIPYNWYSDNSILRDLFSILIGFISLGLIPVVILTLLNSPLFFAYSKFIKK
ncbi:MAG: hypothetical protein H7196_04415 [candidate division SR1 bacterium]|nr:hypothetical protein [candidate division SR1 bacterium]